MLIAVPTGAAGWRAGPRLPAALACLVCGLVTGCGGSSAPPGKPAAQRVCGGGQHAAAVALSHAVTVRVVNPEISDLECTLTGPRVRIRLISQASAQAYIEFDTEDSHQSQVYGPAGPGVHQPGQQPSQTTVPGSVVAVWIRAQKLLVATDATPTTNKGSYLTVQVSGHGTGNHSALGLARAVARAAFAAHPSQQ